MLVYDPSVFFKSELVHLVAVFAAVRVWFAKEIHAGREYLYHMKNGAVMVYHDAEAKAETAVKDVEKAL